MLSWKSLDVLDIKQSIAHKDGEYKWVGKKRRLKKK